MFKIGDYVVNSKNGVCLIEDIQKMNFSATEKEYYLLIPLQEKNAKLYIPVNTASQRVRLAMNSEQALSFINEGKKNTTVDEHYFKIAENHLYGELSFALQISKEEVIQMIIKNIESTDET